jgi:hypothetical protein
MAIAYPEPAQAGSESPLRGSLLFALSAAHTIPVLNGKVAIRTGGSERLFDVRQMLLGPSVHDGIEVIEGHIGFDIIEERVWGKILTDGTVGIGEYWLLTRRPPSPAAANASWLGVTFLRGGVLFDPEYVTTADSNNATFQRDGLRITVVGEKRSNHWSVTADRTLAPGKRFCFGDPRKSLRVGSRNRMVGGIEIENQTTTSSGNGDPRTCTQTGEAGARRYTARRPRSRGRTGARRN